MNIRYLGHSGFIVETGQAYYLFDYIRGELPQMREGKPLYIFASHGHEDHFDFRILESPLSDRAEAILLGTDIRRTKKRKLESFPESVKKKIIWAVAEQEIALSSGTVLPLKSTDAGAAFVVTEADGTALYHAGDLNWWHWEGEAHSWNRNMEVRFKREIDRLAGRHFQAAFLPLDPRQEDAYDYGMDYFLGKVRVDHVFPMHFWEQYDIIRKYKETHPVSDSKICFIEKENEDYEI